jgi:hypothetical protein
LPNLTISIAILVSVIDARFINVDNLGSRLALQPLCKFLMFEFIPFSIAIGLFF